MNESVRSIYFLAQTLRDSLPLLRLGDFAQTQTYPDEISDPWGSAGESPACQRISCILATKAVELHSASWIFMDLHGPFRPEAV